VRQAEPAAPPARPVRATPAKRSREPIMAPSRPRPVEAENRLVRRPDRNLTERRRIARKRFRIALAVVVILVVSGLLTLVWQPFVRIHNVMATGPDGDGVQALTLSSLSGTYAYVIPHDSIFSFPADAIRTAILNTYPDIDAVSISRTSFTAIEVRSVSRASAFLWCGATLPGASTVASSTSDALPAPCYDADAEGFIFATSTDVAIGTSTDTLRIYALTDSGAVSPLRAHVVEASKIPNALIFIKTLKTMGVSVVSLVIHDDEADLYTPLGVRITYVLGQEQQATALAQASFNTLNVNDPTLEYIDLRFLDKVYIKHKGDTNA
jgi:hypothetical protein